MEDLGDCFVGFVPRLLEIEIVDLTKAGALGDVEILLGGPSPTDVGDQSEKLEEGRIVDLCMGSDMLRRSGNGRGR